MTIVETKTTVKTIVKKQAESADLENSSNVFLVPQNGGHIVGRFCMLFNSRYFFNVNGEIIPYDSLSNIYVL